MTTKKFTRRRLFGIKLAWVSWAFCGCVCVSMRDA